MALTIKTRAYFCDKNVLITGGAGGLGLALAELLKDTCQNIYLLDVFAPAQDLNSNVTFIKCDITNTVEVENAVSTLPQLDIVFNNAGVTHMSLALDTSIETFQRTISINLLGAINLTQAVLPAIVSKQGHLVVISSVAGYTPLYGRSAYSASKHGLEGYSLSLAAEYKKAGLSVSVVRPAYIKTQPKIHAKVNSGTISPGAQKKQSKGDELSPEQAATEILNGVAKNKLFVYIGFISKVAKILFTFAPNLYLRVMTKKSQKEFE